MKNTLRRVKLPAKAIAQFFDRYVTLPFADMIQHARIKCKQLPVYGVFLTVTSTSNRNET